MPDTSLRNSLALPLSTDGGNDFYTGLHTSLETIDAALAKANWNGGAVDPDADNDETEGYAAGSKWYTTTAIWECTDATEGAAVWVQIWPFQGISDHGQLTGLTDDNHKIYLLADGSRAMSASLICAQIASPAAPAVGHTKIYTKSDGRIYRRAFGGLETLLSEASDITTALADYVAKSLVDAKGDLLVGSADNTPAKFSVGTDGQVPVAHASETLGMIWLNRTPGLYYNAITNPQFQINQRAVATYTSATVPANSDDTYLMDQWNLLSDGNDIVDVTPAQATIAPTSAPSALKLEVETANKKFGIVQFLENKDALKFAGKSVSLQLKARTSTGKAIRHIRAAILSWNGTADTITSDVVNAWGNEGTNPTWAANWTSENTPADLTLVADTWTTYKIENIVIDTASMTNIAVVIWCDDTDAAVDDVVYLGDDQLNEGAVCLPFMPKAYDEDQRKCTRFFEKSYKETEALGTNTGDSGIMFYNFGHEANAQRAFPVMFSTRKIKTPTTVWVYDRVGGGGADGSHKISTINAAGNTWTNDVALSGLVATDKSFFIYLTGAIGGVGFHYAVSSEL